MRNTDNQLHPDARIGIVNRGEPAVRFIRAVSEMNAAGGTLLSTVALYIDAEADAQFVRQADYSAALSAFADRSTASSPYLDHELLVRALTAMECSAVWAGWGFVSEDAEFVRAVEDAGMIFLGPSARAMEVLGDKIAAKDLAEQSQVPILPWSKEAVVDVDHARRVSRDIGYPVIVKAAHAGGGRGIRFVLTEDELEEQFKSAREETKRITGDEIVFIEHLVRVGRHLEVQVLADRHGNVNTFGVRDCSVQRRNQKIIEETPPPNLSEAAISEMEAAAARLIRAAEYESAGTVEFLYDVETDRFYFMEVNTRLQVEHPITEQLYGIDLVQGQIRVAMGETVDHSAAAPRGHCMEVRLNAEDPDRGFAPAPGDVLTLQAPAGPGIRVDSGFAQGSSIPQDFDSMVAKIIAYGSFRHEVIGRLRRALLELRIHIKGGTTNRGFLLELLGLPEMRSGGLHTKFVEAYLASGRGAGGAGAWTEALISGAIWEYRRRDRDQLEMFNRQIASIGHPRSLPVVNGHEISFLLRGMTFRFDVRETGTNRFHLTCDGIGYQVTFVSGDIDSRLVLGGSNHAVQVVPRGDMLQVEVDGVPHLLEMEAGGSVRAPAPAVVLAVSVETGQPVAAGDRLLSLEAMKMEMIIEAPSEGVVREVTVGQGQQVAAGQILVLLDAAETETEADVGQPPEASTEVSPIELATFGDIDTVWDRGREEILSVFLGYDRPDCPDRVLSGLVEFAEAHEERRGEFLAFVEQLLSAFVDIEHLFSAERIQAPTFARTVSWQELTFLYHRHEMSESDGIPEVFVASLQKAASYYPGTDLSDEKERNHAFYHLFRSHEQMELKSELLKKLFFILETVAMGETEAESISGLLDRVEALCRRTLPGVADLAAHARYQLVELHVREHAQEERRNRMREFFRLLSDGHREGRTSSHEAESFRETLVGCGPQVMHDLVCFATASDDAKRATALEVIGRRMNRDRFVLSVEQTADGFVRVESEGNRDVVFAVLEADGVTDLASTAARLAAAAEDPEVLLLIRRREGSARAAEDPFFRAAAENPIGAAVLFVGIFYPDETSDYRAYRSIGGVWSEDVSHRSFSPLFFRELRVSRLGKFDLTILYKSDTVYLVSAIAKENRRDERLFALVSAAEAEPEVDGGEAIQRIPEFEQSFMEAVYKMRSEQAKRQRRLFWNRIVVHTRELMGMRARQIKEYGMRLVPRTKDLGLERVVIYTRRKRWSEDVVRELELLFLNISEDQFSLRSRSPSEELLEPMDEYVSSVVRSRQRKTVYPYEVLKLITFAGYPVTGSAPRGEFQEMDIEVDPKSGRQRCISVADRPFGSNESNVVFGIISNKDPQTRQSFTRVVILSDSTKDMGSLAEGECRRVIAALDLAEERDIPVEWLPISSGARIDLESGTENLDWTAATLRRIIQFTQAGGEINVIVAGINVGAQSYWNAEATMLMHTRGLLIMTEDASMLLTGKKALDFSGSVSADTNQDIGGVEKIMAPNGEAQIAVSTLADAYTVLFRHYRFTYRAPKARFPKRIDTGDPVDRRVDVSPYIDRLGQGFERVGDIFSREANPDRKKPFEMRQVMGALIDEGCGHLERWEGMRDAETAIVWETRLGGFSIGLIGIESRSLARLGEVPHDGPEAWSGGTLFPLSSKKVARGINAFSNRLPLVILANLSGFDGSPESLRKLQLEYGAEIGRAVVNFEGPICFVVVGRYHGGAYVVFSRTLNKNMHAVAIEGSFASVLGGAPAAAVVFPRQVAKEALADERIVEAQKMLTEEDINQQEYEDLYQKVYTEKQTAFGQKFDRIHNVERAKAVGSLHEIITIGELRPYLIRRLEEMTT